MIEFFPDDEEEEADSAAPAVDASGQYAFQSDGKFPLHISWRLSKLSDNLGPVAAPQGGFNFGS